MTELQSASVWLGEPELAEVDAAATTADEDLGGRPAAARRLWQTDIALLVGLDGLGLAAAVMAGRLAGGWSGSSTGGYAARLIFVPVLLAALTAYGMYRDRRRRIVRSAFHDLSALGHAILVGLLACWGLSAWWLRAGAGVSVSPVEAATVGLLGLVLVLVNRGAAVRFLSGRDTTLERVLVVGSGQVADAVCTRLARVGDVEVLGLVDDDPPPGSAVIGGLADLPGLCLRLDADRVVVAFSRTPSHETAEMLRSMAGVVPISVVPRFFELVSWRSQVEELHGLPVIDVAPPRLGALAAIGKRSFDLAVSVALLVVLAPALAAIAIGVKLSSPGSVFFKQLRTGRGGRPFAIYKFRTMVDGAEAQQARLVEASDSVGLFKMREDPRVTRLGAFLRRSSLDELPQLINVLIGHMSLVGPRPFTLGESSEIDGWAARRFEVRPGMTGLWQVSGRSELSWQDLRRLDYIYVASWSFWWDLKILWQTPSIVSRRQGAY